MKTIFVSFASFILMTAICAAQDDQPANYGPGWYVSTNEGGLSEVSTISPLTANPTYPGGSSAIAEVITPEITALAGNLQNNPTLIYNYVHDQIRYVHYFGSHKGAKMTLLERSGNDFDQCALLVALLRAAGISSSYQFGVIEIPYGAANQQDYQHWVGATMPNTNWAATRQLVANLNGNGGFPYTAYFSSGDTNDFLFHHVWVQATVNGTNYALDPSFKVYEQDSGISLDSAAGISTNTLLTDVAVGATATSDYVQGLNEANLRTDLKNCAANLVNYIQTNNPDATVRQVGGGRYIVPSSGEPLPRQMALTNFTYSGNWPVSTWQYIPTSLMAVYTLVIPGSSTYSNSFYLPALEAGRLSLVCASNGVAQLYLEDTQLASVQTTGTGSTFTPTISIQHPYGNGISWSFSLPGLSPRIAVDDQSVSTQTYQRTNAVYVLLYGLDANAAWMTSRQQQLDSYTQQGYGASSREVMSETLNVMGLSWLAQTELVEQFLASQTSTLLHHHHRLGRMAQETGNGYYIDVYEQVFGDRSDATTNDVYWVDQAFETSGYFESALEHGIIEQMQNSNIVGASTVKLLELASTNNEKIYLATDDNWTAGADVSAQISNYNIGNLYSTYISQGYSLLLPQNGAIQINGAGTWSGSGYVALKFAANSSATMFMIISPGGYGGYSSTTMPPSPAAVTTVNDDQPTYFNPQSATLSAGQVFGADPVNLADGTFQITSSDLTLGKTEPRGLNLTRYYSSARRNSNPAGMAPGWLHNYYCTATAVSTWQAGLGGTTPQQMAPILVASRAALDVFNSAQAKPGNWMTTILIAKWGIDQLINNAVSVNLGKDTLQFLKQPDGSYTPPGNCTMSMTQTNGAYWLQERHGRTFTFGTNNVLTNIMDQYSQSMKLSYNSNNLVTNVTDWTNRSLTFTYTGGALASVTDSSGRSVSYGYANGELTSHTDPEQKTTTYAYDTNNELVATFDALGRLVVTNIYDGFGHVTNQLTEGDSNKTWQIYASGDQTVEIDPAGDRQVYTYDNKSRLIAVQDGMGNVTQMAYDGQDHVIQTISPLNETNQFIYDGNNNLIKTIDPLGFSNTYVFDSRNNLITSIDRLGIPSHFGYNSQFSLTGMTNGNGDWSILTYNANGTLYSRQDSVGTTTYGYDSYGTLNSITYPGGLGSESFVNNALGDPKTHTDGNGNQTTFAYNNRRQLTNTVAPTNITTTVTFDPNANVSTITDPRGSMTSNNWSTTRHLLTTMLPPTPQGTPVVTSTYDNRDWLASTQNPLGQTAYYTNDAAHRLIAATDPLQRATIIGYDNDSHQTTSMDAAGDLITQLRDARGSLIKIIDAVTNTIGKAYDGAGNLIYLTNRNGKLWTFQYDGANRLTNTISPLLHSSSQVYNNRGLLQSSIDPLNQTSTFSHDARGRMTSKTDNIGVNNYVYDGNNNLTQLTNVSGHALSWVYDAFNRPVSFTSAAGYLIQYRYDANGNVTNLIYPGNLTLRYYYDSNNRLTNVTDWSGRQTVIAYDLAGHITSVTRPNNTVRLTSYDNAGELTNIVEETTTKFPICFYTLHYNLAARTDWEFKGPLPHSNSIPTRIMTYDADNRLATFNGTAVTVDSDGNLTYGPGTNNTFQTYTYDPRNELTSAGGIGYGYDPAGNRTSLTNGATATTFVINPKGSQVLMRIRPSSTNYYIYGVGLLYEIDVTAATTTTAFYHFDCRGSTVALTDGNGNPTDAIEYSPYGSTTYRFGMNDTPFLYNGQFSVQTDPNGLMFFHARYYNPYISRFLNPDPSAFAGGLNFYAFANGNPISEVDPFGLGGMWYNSLASWANSTASTAQSFYANNLPWAAAGALNTAISVVGNVLNTPQAIANVGTGTGTFSANPTLANSAGVFSDISIVAGTLAAGMAPLPSANVPIGYDNVVYRYVPSDEAQAAQGGFIPNTYANTTTPKTVYVTSDSPLTSSTDVESTYQIGAQNPNGATPTPQYIIAGDGSSVGLSGPTPVVGGTGTEMTTSQQIPVISVNPIGYNLVNVTTAAGTSWLGGAVSGSSTGK